MQVINTYSVHEKKVRSNQGYKQAILGQGLHGQDSSGIDEQIVPSVRYIFAGRKVMNMTDLSYIADLQITYRSR